MKKKILSLLILFISLFTTQVNAKQFYSGEEVVIKGKNDNSVFITGTEIDLSSIIDGSSFIAGRDIKISSKQDIIFAIGEEIEIEDAYTKDTFIAATTLEIENSQVRDIYAYAQKIEINSSITNNAYLAATKVVINTEITGNLNIIADEIVIGDNTIINGTLSYPEHSYIRISKDAIINKTKTYNTKEQTQSVLVKNKVKELIVSYISILIIGLLLLELFKDRFENISNEEFNVKNIIRKVLLGLCILIIIPIITIIALISIIGVPISFILLALYIIGIYLSIIPSGYYFANKILKDKIKNEYLLLAIGIGLIKIIEFIPVIGGFISFISLCYGMTSIFDIRKKAKLKK